MPQTQKIPAVNSKRLNCYNWAKDMGLIRETPKIRPPRTPKGDKVMKGRPVTTEEYERMLMMVEAALTPNLPEKPKKRKGGPKPKAPDAETVAAWQRLLTGLWWSGLRLSEALRLSWELSDPVAVVMQPGYRPVFQFRAGGQKSGKAELCPMAPEFAEWLELIPEAERTGRVFKLPTKSFSTAGKTITAIGAKAGVIVDEASGKTASAHDFRRAFGTRWAKRVMPAVLRRLMRHASVQTTLLYYVDQEADDVAEDVWKAYQDAKSNTSGNSRPKTPSRKPGESS
jgi:integrase